MKTTNRYVLAILLLCSICTPLLAAERDHYGTEFNFPPPIGAFETQGLFIVSREGATGTVSNPEIGLNRQFVVPPNGSVFVNTLGLRGASLDRVTDNSFRVVADTEVAVFWSKHRRFDMESYLLYPIDTAGTEYLLTTYFWSQNAAGGQFNITAVYDNTQVTIVPTQEISTFNSKSVNHPTGVPYTVVLDAGQTYNVTQRTDLIFDPDRFAPDRFFKDLTGTRVSANKPIHVVGGNGCGNIPINANACDKFFDAIPPLNTWGKSFLFAPFAFKPSGSLIRVIASQPDTEIKIDGIVVATIGTTEKYDAVLTEPAHIETSNPGLVIQYMRGASLDLDVNGDPVGDPSMMVLVPTEQFHDDYLVSMGYDLLMKDDSMNIVIPTTALPSFRLDGKTIDTSGFVAIPGTTYSTGTITRDPRSNTALTGYPDGAVRDPGTGFVDYAWPLTADEPFGVYVYSFARYASIAHPGGQRFEVIYPIGDVFKPSVVTAELGETLQITISDSEDINTNGLLDAGEDLNNNSVIDPRTEDLNGDGVLQITEDRNGNNFLDTDLGLQSVAMLPGSVNLDVAIPVFSVGATALSLTATRLDLTLPAEGTLRVVDVGGNSVDVPLSFGPVGITNVRVISNVSPVVEIDPASYSIPPFSVMPGPDGTAVEWRFDTLDVAQIESIDFDVWLRNPTPGEARVVTHSLELRYTDINGNDVFQELGEYSADVFETALDLNIATDASTYVADETVAITATLTNLSDIGSTRNLRLVVRDPDGVLVTEVASVDGIALGALATETVSDQSFDTGSTLVGTYVVHADIVDASGNVLQNAVTNFSIASSLADSVIATAITDIAAYAPFDTAQITARVQNDSSNQFIDGAVATTTVTEPGGSTVLAVTNAIRQLAPGALVNFRSQLPFGAGMPGIYTINVTVVSVGGAEIASNTTSVELLSTAVNGTGLAASIAVAPNPVDSGDVIEVTVSLANNGNAAVMNLNYTINVFNPGSGDILASFPANVDDLQPGAVSTVVNDWDVVAEAGTVLGVAVTSVLNGRTVVLGNTLFAVSDVNIDTLLATVNGQRLLVLLDAPHACDDKDHDSGEEESSHNDSDDSDHQNCNQTDADDPHGPQGVPSLNVQRLWLENQLAVLGVSYTLTTDADAFTRELRSGGYTDYALFSEHNKLDEQVQKELREAVYRGEGLLVAGAHDNRHKKLNDALGLEIKGKLTAPTVVAITGPDAYADSSASLLFADKVSRFTLEGAEIVGLYPGLPDCESDNDSHHEEDDADHGESNNESHEDDAENDSDGNDSHESDSHNDDHNSASRCPNNAIAITRHAYGNGRSVAIGFDLLVQAAAANGADPRLAQLLTEALADIQTTPADWQPYAPALIRLSLSNTGIATPGRAIITLPLNSTVLDAGNAQAQPDGNLIWPFALAQSATETLNLWLQLPPQAGPAHTEALIQVGIDPDWTDYANQLLTLSLSAAPTLAQVADQLAPLKGQNKHYKKALKKVQKAQAYLDEGNADKALKQSLKAAEKLAKLSTDAAAQIRVQLAQAIRSIERQL